LEVQFWVPIPETIGSTKSRVPILKAQVMKFRIALKLWILEVQRVMESRSAVVMESGSAVFMESRSSVFGPYSGSHRKYGKVEHENGLKI